MQKETEKIIKDIKALRIQGARNVAKASIYAIIGELKHSKAKTSSRLLSEIMHAGKALCASRPTEPMMRNSFDELVALAKKLRTTHVQDMRKSLITYEKQVLKRIKEDKQKLTEYGARLIPRNALIMTHCHSSTATGILLKAKKMKKKFRVIACETRPRWQGRITAKELADAGIDTTLIVDGGANMFMKKADMVIVGADAITSRGDLVNKVGTSMIAHIAKMHDVSFYSAAELFKYSPMTRFGVREKIEQRDPKEVWKNAPKKVKIENPAFDVTAARYLAGYITEEGIIPPQSFFTLANKKISRDR